MDRENVIKGLECCSKSEFPYGEIECNSIGECPYTELAFEGKECCISQLIKDALALLKEQEEERKRMLNWLGKFCRHIDNGDKWLPDEENIAFFREKMKRQFGWDVEDDA